MIRAVSPDATGTLLAMHSVLHSMVLLRELLVRNRAGRSLRGGGISALRGARWPPEVLRSGDRS